MIDVGARPELCVRVLLWGVTDRDVDFALDHATRAPGRRAWQFVVEQRHTSATCPLDLEDRKALAAEQGYGWAYVVLLADAGEAP